MSARGRQERLWTAHHPAVYVYSFRSQMLRVAVTQFTRPTLRQTLRQAVRRRNGQEAVVSSEPGKGEAPSPRRPRSVERARRGAGRLTGARLSGQSLARSVGQTRGRTREFLRDPEADGASRRRGFSRRATKSNLLSVNVNFGSIGGGRDGLRERAVPPGGFAHP